MAITIGILLPTISSELHLSPGEQGVLGSSAFWGNLALAVPLGWWTSRFGPKILTTSTLVVGTACIFMQGLAPGFIVLLIARLGFGISIVARIPARAMVTQQWFPERQFIVVNSVSNLLFGLVVGGGLLATPFILSALGDNWRTTLHTFGGLFVVLTILWVVLGRERPTSGYLQSQIPREIGVLRGTLGYRDLWIVGIGFLGANVASSAFLTFFPTVMLETFQVPLRWSGGVLALSIAVGGVSGLVYGYVVKHRHNGSLLLQASGLLMAVSYAAMTLTGSPALLLALSFVNGVTWGFWPILYTVPFKLPGIRSREVGMALAFIAMMISAGSVLGPLMAGFLQQALGAPGLSLQILSFSALSLTAAGLLLRTGAD